MEKDTVIINGEEIEFLYTRKKIKNLILKVNNENQIVLSLPKRASLYDAKKFIIKKYSWIQKSIESHNSYNFKRESKDFSQGDILYLFGKQYKIEIIPSRNNYVRVNEQNICIEVKEKYIEDKKYIMKTYEEWLKEFARSVYIEYISKYQKQMEPYNIPYPELYIRKMKSRWGECFPKKNKIVLNLSLVKVPKECIEYVIVHELAHFKYQNHSKDFYNFVEKFIPNWKENRRVLNKEFTRIII